MRPEIAAPHSFLARSSRSGPRVFLKLQGPFSPFYYRLSQALREQGVTTLKVHLNGADIVNWGSKAPSVSYRGGFRNWRHWISNLMVSRRVTDLVVHADCQRYHAAAISAAKRLDVRIHVTEQGYLRPHWVTLEQGGVNANSSLFGGHRSFTEVEGDFARQQAVAEDTGACSRLSSTRALSSNIALYLLAPVFPGYVNAFSYSPILQGLSHVGRFAKNCLKHQKDEKDLASFMEAPEPFYLVLLQRPGDSQIHKHSSFGTVSNFCREVLTSFAAFAPSNARLLFKAHPLDHGLDDHRAVIRKTARALGVDGRIHYAERGDLTSMLKGASGAVTVNSTSGLASLDLLTPTIALGRALYDVPGLTFQGQLDDFWLSRRAPSAEKVNQFLMNLLIKTQINGDFSTEKGMELALPAIMERLLQDEGGLVPTHQE